MEAVAASHIWLDDRGRAWIDDTNVKVIEVVLDHTSYGSSPQEMHEQYPHLSLAQIHAALAYYCDHKQEFDEEIERQIQRIEAMAEKADAVSPFRRRMRELGKLP
jgi:uncharacterized protein (DUF433 family)